MPAKATVDTRRSPRAMRTRASRTLATATPARDTPRSRRQAHARTVRRCRPPPSLTPLCARAPAAPVYRYTPNNLRAMRTKAKAMRSRARDTLSSPEGTPSNRLATRTKARATPSSQAGTPSSPEGMPSNRLATRTKARATPSSQEGTPSSPEATPTLRTRTRHRAAGTPTCRSHMPSKVKATTPLPLKAGTTWSRRRMWRSTPKRMVTSTSRRASGGALGRAADAPNHAPNAVCACVCALPPRPRTPCAYHGRKSRTPRTPHAARQPQLHIDRGGLSCVIGVLFHCEISRPVHKGRSA
mmetsp:Transcript_11790/g.31810  ORF Transcript_11790/g.31810 Transcript_11790/m.31810 type:complete len:299 (+) Transcript_11790:6577-7473(+)